MSTTNVLPKIITGLLILLVPGAIGWLAGRHGRGKGLVRACAGLALLATVAGVTTVAVGRIAPTGVAAEPGNDFASGRALYVVVGGGLLAIAVLLAIVACGAALAQSRARGHLGAFTALIYTVAVPLFLSVSFFIANLLHVTTSNLFLLGSGLFGAVASLAIAVYAIFGLAGSGPGEEPVSTRAR